MSPGELNRAQAALTASAFVVGPGPWSPSEAVPPGHFGYLVTGGVVIRRVELAGGSSAEVLGPGDLLRPWQEDAASFAAASWEVLEKAEILELEPSAAQRLCEWPVVVANLLERGLRRSRSLAVYAALSSITGLEQRVLTLFWQLAEIWGRTGPEGVVLELRLPQRLVAELVGARRPSVTSALARLQREGRLAGDGEGCWRLLGDPPA